MVTSKFPEPITGIMGPPGAGKTFLAGTLIPQFNAAVKAKKPHTPTVKVDDVIWLQFDRAGADTLRAYGVEPRVKDVSTPPTARVDLFANEPSSVILSKLRDTRIAWMRHIDGIVKEIAAEARAGTCRLVVVDSMTAFARMLTDAFLIGELIASSADKFNKQQQYGFANLAIGQIVNTMKSIPVAQVWLLHVRMAYSENTAEQLDASVRRPVQHTMELDVQRGVQSALEPVPSMMLGAKATGGQGGKVDYHLITRPDGSYPIKNRWAARLPVDTTPDLQRVWDIISSANSAEG